MEFIEGSHGDSMVSGGRLDSLSVGDGLDLISPDGKLNRTLTSREFAAYNFSRDGSQVYGIFHNMAETGPECQLYEVNVKTGAEKLLQPWIFRLQPVCCPDSASIRMANAL